MKPKSNLRILHLCMGLAALALCLRVEMLLSGGKNAPVIAQAHAAEDAGTPEPQQANVPEPLPPLQTPDSQTKTPEQPTGAASLPGAEMPKDSPKDAREAPASAAPGKTDKPAGANVADKKDTAPQTELSFTPSEMDLLQSLAKRRADLDAREKAVAEKEALLKAAEEQMDAKNKEMTSLKGDLEKLLGQQTEDEKNRTESLVKVYETMKPKDAARVLDSLDSDVLLRIAASMKPKKLAPIMASMDGEKARQLTMRLAILGKLPEEEKTQTP